MKSWYINPREPFNTRIWQEIASEFLKTQMIEGCAWLSIGADGHTIRLISETAESEDIDPVE